MADHEILFFDVETTGLSRTSDRIVQIAWILADRFGNASVSENYIVKPEGYVIPNRSASVHGIDNETALKWGRPAPQVLQKFASDARSAQILVGHNISFDIGILTADLRRHGISLSLADKLQVCTMRASTRWCRLPKINGSPGFKFPRLNELHFRLFGEDFECAHDAKADVEATMRCFYELVSIQQIVLPARQGSPKHRPAKPTPTTSRVSGKGQQTASQFHASRSAVWLTRRSQIICNRCGTEFEVTLNYRERQAACPSCYAINNL